MLIEKLRGTLRGCIVQRSSDGKYLCTDGKWRNGCADKYKFYRRVNAAIRFGLKEQNGSVYSIYYGDEIDIHDHVVRWGSVDITEVADGVNEYKYFGRKARAGRTNNGRWVVNFGDSGSGGHKICTDYEDANYRARKFVATGRVV